LTAAFVPGLELSRAFYEEVVAQLVAAAEHSAALLGGGSEVLGYDTARSTDHGWGPRVQVFVSDDKTEAELRQRIEAGLPDDFRGRPTRFGWDDRPVVHHVEVVQLGAWLEEQLGFDPRDGLSNRDWLTAPQQLLLEVTRGAVFHDGLGELEPLRQALEWYPRDVWIWLLACQWRRLDQEEPFLGRTAEVGDDLGSRILAARLVRDLMRLCFLLERRYAPYSKWMGSAFAGLDSAAEVGPSLEAALEADDFASREEALVRGFERVAERHNALGVTAPVDATARSFYTRPFRVLGSSRFVEACLAEVADPSLRSLPLVGSVDQLADSTDVLSYPPVARRLGAAYATE
jgi:hypothetical protein